MRKQKGGIVNSSTDGQIRESEQWISGIDPVGVDLKLNKWQQEFVENCGNKKFVFSSARRSGKNYIQKELEKAAYQMAKALSYSVDAQILVKNGMAEVQADGSVKLNENAQIENITPEMIKETSEALKAAYPQSIQDPGRMQNIFGRDFEPKIQIPDNHAIDSFRYAVQMRFGTKPFGTPVKKTLWEKIKFFFKYTLKFKIKKWLKKIKK